MHLKYKEYDERQWGENEEGTVIVLIKASRISQGYSKSSTIHQEPYRISQKRFLHFPWKCKKDSYSKWIGVDIKNWRSCSEEWDFEEIKGSSLTHVSEYPSNQGPTDIFFNLEAEVVRKEKQSLFRGNVIWEKRSHLTIKLTDDSTRGGDEEPQ